MNTLGHELERASLDFELIPHALSHSAMEEARAVGVPPTWIGKTVILHTSDGYVRAVLPGTRRLDLHRVRKVLGDKHARLATETELTAAYPMFELGAVPPLGGPGGDRVLLDKRIAEHDTVIVEAGTHDESVRMQSASLLALTHATVADICRH